MALVDLMRNEKDIQAELSDLDLKCRKAKAVLENTKTDKENRMKLEHDQQKKIYIEKLSVMPVFNTSRFKRDLIELQEKLNVVALSEDDTTADIKDKTEKLALLNSYSSSLIELNHLIIDLIGEDNFNLYKRNFKLDKPTIHSKAVIKKYCKLLKSYKFKEYKAVTKKDKKIQGAYVAAFTNAPVFIFSVIRDLYVSLDIQTDIDNAVNCYLTLENSILALSTKTNEQIAKATGIIISNKTTKLMAQIEKLENNIKTREDNFEAEKNKFEFDASKFNKEFDKIIADLEDEISVLQNKLDKTNMDLSDIQAKIKKEKEKLFTNAQLERLKYLSVDNSDRTHYFPDKLIWDYSEDKTRFIAFKSSIVVADTQETLNNFVRLVTFQLRNYVSVGDLNILNLDSLAYGSAVPFLNMQNNSNHDVIHSVKKDVIANMIDSAYSNFLVNMNTIGGKPSIKDYNINASKVGSATLPSYYVIIYARKLPSITDEVAQLISQGSKYGVVVHIILLKEHAVKFTDDYKMLNPPVLSVTSNGFNSVYLEDYDEEPVNVMF